MALEKVTVVDQVSIDPQTGVVSIRTVTLVVEDGAIVGEIGQPHRAAYTAGQVDIESLPAEVREIVRAAWTPEMVKAQQARERGEHRA